MEKNVKKQVLVVVSLVSVILICLLGGGDKSGLFTAGGGGNLKSVNEKTKVTVIADVNQTTMGQSLAQITAIGTYRKTWNENFYFDGYILGGLSTEFGYTMPYMSVAGGYDSELWNVEYKIGQYKRNSLFFQNLDPQFSNFVIVNGTGSAATGMQVASTLKSTGTTFAIGHNGGNEFYKLDGVYYTTLSQTFGQFNLSGGVEFGQKLSGFTAGTWSDSKNSVTFVGNNLGTENRSYITSYARMLTNGFVLSTSLFSNLQEQRVHMVGSYALKSGLKIFAQMGLSSCSTTSPYGGLGCSYVF